MRETDLNHLACPHCSGDLIISSIESRDRSNLESAQLTCPPCQTTYPVVRGCRLATTSRRPSTMRKWFAAAGLMDIESATATTASRGAENEKCLSR
jgi:uncharacterized protein YbaR (Trm112 family)